MRKEGERNGEEAPTEPLAMKLGKGQRGERGSEMAVARLADMHIGLRAADAAS